MSHTSNIILLCAIDDPGIEDVQLYLKTQKRGALINIGREAGGGKFFEIELWAAAYNHLNSEELMKTISEAKWEEEDQVSLIVYEENRDPICFALKRSRIIYRQER